jgi:hypothetical protein
VVALVRTEIPVPKKHSVVIVFGKRVLGGCAPSRVNARFIDGWRRRTKAVAIVDFVVGCIKSLFPTFLASQGFVAQDDSLRAIFGAALDE